MFADKQADSEIPAANTADEGKTVHFAAHFPARTRSRHPGCKQNTDIEKGAHGLRAKRWRKNGSSNNKKVVRFSHFSTEVMRHSLVFKLNTKKVPHIAQCVHNTSQSPRSKYPSIHKQLRTLWPVIKHSNNFGGEQ